MKHRLLNLGLVGLLAGAGLAPGAYQGRADHDLDSYSDAELIKDLTAELDDIEVGDGGQLEPDGEYALEELRSAILFALSDDGDDAAERDIDFTDLEDEADEAGTTLEDVVDAALARADELALRAEPRVRRASVSDTPRFRYASTSLAVQSRDQKGFTTTSVAIRQTVVLTVSTIRRVAKRS
jgi:hypothetical protein